MFLWGDVDFGKIEPSSVVHTRAFGTPFFVGRIFPTSAVHTRAFGTPSVGLFVVVESVIHTRAVGTPSFRQFITPGARDTGFKPGFSVANVDTGNPAWTFPDGAAGVSLWDDDSMKARVSLTSLQNSDDLNVNTLKLQVSGVVVGIEVEIVVTGAPAFSDLFVAMTKNGITPVGVEKDISDLVPGTFVRGGPTDLWGQSWTKAEVEADGFGVTIEISNDVSAGDVDIDRVRVKVYTASLSVVHQRTVETPTVGAAVTTLVLPSVVHTRTVGTAVITISSFSQTIFPSSTVHSRNISGPTVIRAGDPSAAKQRTASHDWQVSGFEDKPLSPSRR